MILYAIASRDAATAKEAARKYGFQKAYASYQDLLDDPAVDIVYISTPNSLHFEWAANALKAGKHVLCEKPFTANADEARRLVQLANERGLICVEAVRVLTSRFVFFSPLADPSISSPFQFHWQFHPAAHLFRQLLESGEYGRVLRTDAVMTASPGIPHGDIRWKFELAGTFIKAP